MCSGASIRKIMLYHHIKFSCIDLCVFSVQYKINRMYFFLLTLGMLEFSEKSMFLIMQECGPGAARRRRRRAVVGPWTHPRLAVWCLCASGSTYHISSSQPPSRFPQPLFPESLVAGKYTQISGVVLQAKRVFFFYYYEPCLWKKSTLSVME